MRHLEGISNPEIAEKLELSIEAVESLIARGKRTLSDALQSQKSELGYQND
jgi:RNA polymerase sigma-70 factor (ECF subfamily)